MAEISSSTICIIWVTAIVLFSIAEAVTAQLVSIWFVLGSIAALITALCKGDFVVQIIVFIAVSVLALAITRPLVKKYVTPKKVRTNADMVIGESGVVLEQIDNLAATGQVKVDSQIWTARSNDNSVIPKGNQITVEKIEGVKLIVKSKY